ncbi:phage minor head protein [Pinibacter soli]|uniref:Phage minor head protein n=1 Tax=Pinibacter soli TaxID=3044211 RepID=A0ABT6R9R5_9BACT|nr:phage minor head protein [Pinibacter soli]MDI3319140.1 phage minor head protein [Pinibacter soli]
MQKTLTRNQPTNNRPIHVCCDHSEAFFLSDKQRDQVLTVDANKVVNDVIEQLYKKGTVQSKTQTDLFKSFYEPLKAGVKEGYNLKAEYGTPNYEMLKQLQTNTAIFSIFKSHACVKEIGALLKDNDGNRRSKQDFINEALKVDKTYRKDWLGTEYDTAVRSCRMATVWQKAQETKRLYPCVEYIPSRAANPRQDHIKYYGLVFRLDDPILNTIWPPNGYLCQCGMRPTDKEPTDIPHDLPLPDEHFRFNPGKTGQVFDIENSGYIKSVPPADQPALIKQAKTIVNNEMALEADYQSVYKAKSGGTVEVHPLAFNNTDFKEVLVTARELANFGEQVKVLPDIQDPALRKAFVIPGAKPNKSPDYLITGTYATDLKTVFINSIDAVKEAVGRCNKQCNNIALKIDRDNYISSHDLQRAVKGKLSHAGYDDWQMLWIFFNGDWKSFTRQEILEGSWF